MFPTPVYAGTIYNFSPFLVLKGILRFFSRRFYIMSFIFALIALLCWSGSDLFSKLGTSQKDKNSHFKVMFAVGVIMGLHAIITIIVSAFIPPIEEGADPEWWRNIIYTDFKPADFLRYAPVAAIYLLAMVIGYAGLRYIELSVSSPICNSSGSLALLICIIAGWATIDAWSIVAVVLITIGIVSLGVVEYREDEAVKLARQDSKQFKYTKSLIAILIPIIYLLMDALGTVGDKAIEHFELFDMTEYASNTSFEFTALLFAIISFVIVKFVKKEKFFAYGNEPSEVGEKLTLRKSLIIGGACETVGQIFYMAVVFSDFDAGLPMISAYCVLSVLWSRIFLKEKLSALHYIAIGLTFAGIILLGIFSPV